MKKTEPNSTIKKDDKKTVSFGSFFSDKSTPETEEKANDKKGEKTLSP